MTGSSQGARRASPRFLSIADVAERLDLSTKTIRRWIAAGELPVHRLGRQFRVSEDALELFLHRHKQ